MGFNFISHSPNLTASPYLGKEKGGKVFALS